MTAQQTAATGADGSAEGGARHLSQVPGIRAFLVGQTVSLLGDSALWLALGIWVKSLTGSNSAAGMVPFFFMAGTLAAPLAGLLLDRLPVRAALGATNLATAALVLALLTVRDAGDVWLIYVVALGSGVAESVLDTGRSVLLARLVPDELLPKANSLLQAGRQGLRLVAPLLGAGLLVAFGPAVVLLLDSATFLIAAATLPFLLAPIRPAPGAHNGGSWLHELVAGARCIARTIELRQLLVACVVALLAFGFVETALFAVVDEGLHQAPAFLAVLITVESGGAILASLAASAVINRVGERLAVVIGLSLFGLAAVMFAAPVTGVVLTGALFAGLGLPLILIGATTLLQRRAPAHLQGRVYGAFVLCTSVPQTLSIALGAGLIMVVDYRLLLGLLAGSMAVAGWYLATRANTERTSAQPPRGERVDRDTTVRAGATPAEPPPHRRHEGASDRPGTA